MTKHNHSDKNDLDLLHEKTIEILTKTGVIFNSTEAIEQFKGHGAKTLGNKVYIDKKMLESALATVPESFVFHGRNTNITIGNDETIKSSAYGPVTVLENDAYHKPTFTDYINFHKLDESSTVIDLCSPYVVDLPSIDYHDRGMTLMAISLLMHEKPLLGTINGKSETIEALKLVKQFYDDDQNYISMGLINLASPLQYFSEMADALVDFPKANQPVMISGTGISGLTSPETLASTILVVNAGILAGIVLTQLINPGNPVVYGIQGFGSDLRKMVLTIGSPEDALINAMAKCLGTYYGIPTRSGGSASDSKKLDMQCGFESFNLLHSALSSGTDIMSHACGVLDSYNSISYEKYLIDEELIQMVERYIRGFKINESTLCSQIIQQVGPGGHFIKKVSAEHKKEFYWPKLPVRMPLNQWQKEGQPDIKTRSKQSLEARLNAYQLPSLTKKQAFLIKDLVPKDLKNAIGFWD